ncbi:Uncharacterized protein Fot_01524 [Forsythia ovata]|uniref:Uncharacterized protein n=1 Tax=Forsythia ovata TaxID=205694 RepID=A0ABD1X480_9LAMI
MEKYMATNLFNKFNKKELQIKRNRDGSNGMKRCSDDWPKCYFFSYSDCGLATENKGLSQTYVDIGSDCYREAYGEERIVPKLHRDTDGDCYSEQRIPLNLRGGFGSDCYS